MLVYFSVFFVHLPLIGIPRIKSLFFSPWTLQSALSLSVAYIYKDGDACFHWFSNPHWAMALNKDGAALPPVRKLPLLTVMSSARSILGQYIQRPKCDKTKLKHVCGNWKHTNGFTKNFLLETVLGLVLASEHWG